MPPSGTVLPCVDMARARKFYGEVLGLEALRMPGIPEEQYSEGAMFQCGGGTMLFVYQRPEPTKAEHTAAGWMVSDIEATADALIAKGVKLEVCDMPDVTFDDREVATSGNLKSAWFKDSDGNSLALNQMR